CLHTCSHGQVLSGLVDAAIRTRPHSPRRIDNCEILRFLVFLYWPSTDDSDRGYLLRLAVWHFGSAVQPSNSFFSADLRNRYARGSPSRVLQSALCRADHFWCVRANSHCFSKYSPLEAMGPCIGSRGHPRSHGNCVGD